MSIKYLRICAAVAAVLLSAYAGYAQSCPVTTGLGFDNSCFVTGACAGIGYLFYSCIEEQCYTNYGQGCFPQNFTGCAFAACLNPFHSYCTGCGGGQPPHTDGGGR